MLRGNTQGNGMLYKYRSLPERSKHKCIHPEEESYDKRILTHNEIYFASSEQFNDPFDCRVIPEFDEQYQTQNLEWFNTTLKFESPKWLITPVKVSGDMAEINLTGDNPEVQAYFKKQFIKVCADNFGILSLSSHRDNILMWSHYADSHNGFCVGFKKDKLENFFDNRSDSTGRGTKEIRVFKIKYEEKYPAIVPATMDRLDNLVGPLVVKHSGWAYEQEYRGILLKGTRETVVLDDGIIAEVILGCEMKQECQDEIIKILLERPSKVKLYQAKQVDNHFALEFEEITYG
jgi:hypothetical protein